MVAILVNPTAGRSNKAAILDTITQKLEALKLPFTVFSGNWPPSCEGFSQVWLVGGDGTLNFFINHYDCSSLPLAIFKGGTGNDFAWKLYGDRTVVEQVDLVLHARPRPVDAGVCNGRFFLNTLGIGFDGRVLGFMKLIRFLGSQIGYYLAVLRMILTYKEPVYVIHPDQDPALRDKFLLLAVSNAPRTGGGFLVSPHADPTDGRLNLVCCTALSVFKRLQILPLVRSGRHIYLDLVKQRLVRQLLIVSDETQPAQLDGELIHAREFHCTVAPKQFLFLY